MKFTSPGAITCCALALALPAAVAHSQSAQQGASTHQSGYDKVEVFGGPDSVSGQLQKNDEKRESIYQFDTAQRWLKPYFDWKREQKEKNGLALGFNVWWLYQNASATLGPEDDAAGGIYRFQGSWTALGRDTDHPGRLEWRVENRSELGRNLAPQQLGGEIGLAALNSGFAYSHNFKTDISVLNWTQLFADQRAGVAVGRLDFAAYLDAFAFQTFSRGFLNRSFVVNPTLGTTGIGALGAVMKGFVTDQLWLGGQIYDGNAASGDFDIDTFEEGEWLKSVETGWTPSIARRKTDRIQFTYWSKDARAKAGVPKGSGWAISGSWQVSDQWLPFLRVGHSDGGAGVAAEEAVSAGFEFNPRRDQALSVGAGWAKPVAKTVGSNPRDEYVIETSYRFQLSQNFSLTPDLQLLIDPANNPAEDRVWVLGLRAYLTM